MLNYNFIANVRILVFFTTKWFLYSSKPNFIRQFSFELSYLSSHRLIENKIDSSTLNYYNGYKLKNDNHLRRQPETKKYNNQKNIFTYGSAVLLWLFLQEEPQLRCAEATRVYMSIIRVTHGRRTGFKRIVLCYY